MLTGHARKSLSCKSGNGENEGLRMLKKLLRNCADAEFAEAQKVAGRKKKPGRVRPGFHQKRVGCGLKALPSLLAGPGLLPSTTWFCR